MAGLKKIYKSSKFHKYLPDYKKEPISTTDKIIFLFMILGIFLFTFIDIFLETIGKIFTFISSLIKKEKDAEIFNKYQQYKKAISKLITKDIPPKIKGLLIKKIRKEVFNEDEEKLIFGNTEKKQLLNKLKSKIPLKKHFHQIEFKN